MARDRGPPRARGHSPLTRTPPAFADLESRNATRIRANCARMSRLLKSTGAVAGATLISRVLGLAREMAYARFMGNGAVASAFLLAFLIPNLFRRLLGEGALTASFLPVFKEKERTEGEAAMWRSANAVLSGLVVIASAVVLTAIGIVTAVLHWGELESETRLMLELLRIMFPYTLFVCVAAIGMGMLNARGRFFVPALGATMLNLVLIVTVLFVAPRVEGGLPRQIYVVAYGVLVAGLAQAVFQAPMLLRQGWRFRWVTPWRDDSVREVMRRMLPTTIGVAAFQLNMVITQGFAFFMGESIVASFLYAVRLMELPQGLFGASLATYLLPTLSGLAADRKYDEFRGTLLNGLTHLTVINALAAVLLAVLARPIIRLLFEGGMFGPGATERVAFALMFLAPGLVAFSATNTLARAFYAVGETRVPMQIAVFCLCANTVLALLFVLGLREGGLALANSITSVANAGLLGYALKRKFRKLSFAGLRDECRRIAVAVAGAGVVVWLASRAWERWLGAESLPREIGAVFGPAAAGAAVYFAILYVMGSPSCRELAGVAIQSFRRRRERVAIPTEEV